MTQQHEPSQQSMLEHFWALGEDGAADEPARDPLGGYLFVIREADEARWGALVAEGRRLHVFRSTTGVQGRWF